ncbi:ACT domain-containing protein [Syntrophus aciditrophicus]|uniref:Acetolactate synthase small subunit n=1 Tax=Syntrophus aciditrophicus (strain SB) TaxID=56780 RepID=Q2LWE3_SYNAS|nr:ACT domain-containing protein [Syntrophus aciditrophicus]ABC78399.1 acetolactate synthase small subunit [Syntrophus aciditrophicus SB]OPY18081.1 MAG: acetolactate synthase 3 regulatory subunit [Syntrophus sp. PtaB.Bin075]
MNVTQLSVFLENKPGRLQNILRILYENNINITALTISETQEYGVLRMIVNDPDKAQQALKGDNITSRMTDVLAIEIDDKPGSLFKVIEAFSKRGMNIEYMYAFPGKNEHKCVMIFRFENIEAAKNILATEGYTIVKKIDLIGE